MSAGQPLRAGFIGLGIMGSRMAANLARAGFPLTVWNRTAAKAEPLVREHGATLAASPAEVARASDVVITIVVDTPQVEAVLLGPDGVAEGAATRDPALPPLLCVDMSTIAPADSRAIAGTLAAQGVRFLDAPVTGSSPKAEDGTLTIMVGGAQQDFERALPLFEAMGELVRRVGDVGDGELVKLVNNSLAAINLAAVCEALLLAKKAGVDLDAVVEIVQSGAGASFMLGLKGDPVRTHDFTPLFKLEHMLKDVRHTIETGQSMGVPLTFAAHARELYTAAMGRGHAEDDFAAVVTAAEGLAGLRLDQE